MIIGAERLEEAVRVHARDTRGQLIRPNRAIRSEKGKEGKKNGHVHSGMFVYLIIIDSVDF